MSSKGGHIEQKIREARLARLARTLTDSEIAEVHRLMSERPKVTQSSPEAWRGAVEVVLADRVPSPERPPQGNSARCTANCHYEQIDGLPWFVFSPNCEKHSRLAQTAYTQREREYTSVEVAA